MASQPPEVFLPRPGFLSRARNAWGAFLGGEAPAARPNDVNPVESASPQLDGAPVPTGTYSRAYGGFSVDPRWLSQLAMNNDTILAREGQHDLALYDAILDDDTAASAFQQRRLAVISRPWEVEAGDESAQAEEAAEHLRQQIKEIGWDSICDKMLFGRWYGYAVAECLYEVGPDGKIWLQDIIVPDRRNFAFTNSGDLRLRSAESGEGEVLPPNKFWAFRTGASHDFTPYGVGLAHWCYWPVWFKKNVIRFWSVYLEKFGMPTTMGTFPVGADDEVIARTLAAAQAVASDRAIAKPADVEIELLAEGRASGDSYEQFVGEMNDALLRVILSQTGTSKSEAQGLGGSQSGVMKDVRDEVVRSDSDMLHESFNRTVSRWLTAWNFGPNVAAPLVYRSLEDQEDLDSIVARDLQLKELGWKRTEDSAREIYGEGYEPTETEEEKAAREAAMAGPARGIDGARGGNVVDLEQARAERASATFAAEDLDAIDRWTAQLASESDPLIVEFATMLKGRVDEGIKDADQLRVVLLQALENFPAERLGELAAIPYIAARATAESGIEA